jgi:predicted nuclease with TOPRIM domain
MSKTLDQISKEALEEAFKRKNQSIENLHKRLGELNSEIKNYPVPIHGCDLNFNALLEEKDQIQKEISIRLDKPKEVNGPEGPEPTRFGDWEKKGITSDFS